MTSDEENTDLEDEKDVVDPNTEAEIEEHLEQPNVEDNTHENEEDETAREIEELLIQGEDASRNNDIKAALSAFNKAISLDPSCDMAWFNRGVLLEAQQDARGARQSFQICLDLNPDHAPATANMAILLERIGDLEGAYETAKRALEFFPGHPALLDVQKRCRNSGISVAVESMQPSIKPTQSYDEAEMTAVLEETGVENPEDVLAEAVHHDDDDNQHLDIEELRSAATMVAAREAVETQSKAEIQSEEKPEDDQEVEGPSEEDIFDQTMNEVRTLFEQSNYKEVFKILKPHLKSVAAKHSEAWRIAGLALAELGHDTHAIASLTHSLNLESDHLDALLALARLQQKVGNAADAVQNYQKVLAIEATNVEALEAINVHAKDAGLLEDYLQSLRSLSSLGNEISKHTLIQTLLDLADGESNILDNTQGLPPTLPAGPEMAAEALNLIPDTQSNTRARALSLNDDHLGAVTMWKALIQADGTVENWTGLARALERAGDLEKAEKCHAKARSLQQPNELENQNDVLLQPIEPIQSHEQEVPQETLNANAILQTPIEPKPVREAEENPVVDLAKAALDATQASQRSQTTSAQSSSIANHDIQWYNQGIRLLEDKKYREALSSFDKALASFQDDEDMIIRILNGRGNAYYFLEEFPKCIEAYHQAMMIRPTDVRGQTLYNMGAAYASMERYSDAIKCFKQAIPRGLNESAQAVAKDQIRRCEILKKQQLKKKR